MSSSSGACAGSIFNILNPCALSIWASAVPAILVLSIILLSLPWPGPVRRFGRLVASPFHDFLTLAEAKAIIAGQSKVHSNGFGKDSVSEPAVGPPLWKTVILAVVALLETLAWLALGSFKLVGWASLTTTEAWQVWPPLILSVVWVYAAIVPIFRPRPTPPYDLFALYLANTLSAGALLGTPLFLLSADGLPLPSTFIIVGLSFNLAACLLGLLTILSMPLDLPSSQYEKDAIGVTISAEDYTTLWGWIAFTWVTPLVKKGTFATLNEPDVWELSPNMKSRPLYGKYRDEKQDSTLRTILRANSLDLILDIVLTFCSVVFNYAGPFFLKRILDAIANPSPETRSLAYFYAVLAFAASLLKAEADVLHLWYGRRASTRIRSELMADIYEKALRRKDFSGIAGTAEPAAPTNEDSDAKKKKKKEEEPKTDTQADVGKIVQLMSGDANRISMMVSGAYFIYSAPFEIAIASFFLYQLLGWTAFVGFGVLVIATPANTMLSKHSIKISKGLLAARDKRMGVLTELIGAIKFIKFFAWENQWIDRALKARQVELGWIIKNNVNSLAFSFLWSTVPVLVSVISFYAFIAQGNELTVSIAFTAIALFGMLRMPLNVVPSFIVQFLQTRVSVDRIDAFLKEGEVPDYVSSLKRPPVDPSAPLDMRLGAEGASFRWNEKDEEKKEDNPKAAKGKAGKSLKPAADAIVLPEGHISDGVSSPAQSDQPFELADIEVTFPIGKLSVVTGPTASGKTALLMAILGEMTLLRGKVYLPKNPSQVDSHGLKNAISYSAQTAWLEHHSIKNNILFGSPFEEDRYDAVVEACALKPDFAILEDGDQTEIGSRGVALSGGQKARVALARAVYARTKHVLLDDPLAALDSHSARYVFEHLLMGPLMENRTTVLVTHHVELVLPGAYYLVRMLDGRIDTQGTTEELRQHGLLADIALDSAAESKKLKAPDDGEGSSKNLPDADPQDPLKTREPSKAAEAKKPRQLVKDEARAEGSVDFKIYRTYLEASSIYMWIAILIMIVIYQGFGIGEKYWIKVWGEHYDDVSMTSNTMMSAFLHVPLSLDMAHLKFYPIIGSEHATAVLQNVLSWTRSNTSAAAGISTATVTLPTLPSATKDPYFYIGIYAAIGLFAAALSTFNSVFQYIATYKASKSLFARLLQRVVRAPIRWFDVTPSGRIQNRFSRDIETIDGTLSFSLRATTTWLATFVAQLLTVGVVLPPFLIPAFLIGYVYYRLSLGYLNTGRDLRRMESNSKSPIFSGFAELLEGIVTVRAFSSEHRFFNSLHEKIDITTTMWYFFWMLNRWLLLRFDSLGSLSVFLTTLIALSGYVDAGLAGLTITSAMGFTNSVYWTCRMVTQLEMDLNSVERVVEYLDLPLEPPAVIESHRPPAFWPSNTNSESFVVVEDLVIKYSPELEPVLHGISFNVAAREKIGLMGRTGSGKSTLAMSLLRFVEPTSGRIIVDGIDICTIGLQDLRSRITIIPQDAVLFSGTIRENLDPFLDHTDDECYDALYRVQLIGESRYNSRRSSRTPSRAPSPTGSRDEETTAAPSSITSATVAEERSPVTLETQVSAGGTNFSQGQRQLIAMARALLRQSSVIVMDEATASVDFDTDAKIQTTIREEFKNSLLLTVAHRIRTVIDYDRLIVLDAGRLAEFDTPYNLLQKDTGIFKEMCLNSGMYQELYDAAERKAKAGQEGSS